ncbi:hypothetical protein [Burkholderia ambifaria]|uniref:hypothetical protein n=1 Tax=Burkholderia ambifaria TaxID=152480 RepID=UPI00158F4755|nr:hypothetical protein [Burkholderia ambifaria]
MTTAATQFPLIGSQPVGNFFTPDNIQRHPLGAQVTFDDPYWGGGDAMYLAIPTSTALKVGEVVVWDGTNKIVDVPNTANLGMPVALAMNANASDANNVQYGWFLISGQGVALSTASVAAAAQIGIAAAGKLGAVSAGKQILNCRVEIAATTTVVKANTQTTNGSPLLRVSNSDGWFVGAALSGTGIPASTSIGAISADGRTVSMVQTGTTTAQNATASGSVSVTGTYNDGTNFWNVLAINAPFAQGQIT